MKFKISGDIKCHYLIEALFCVICGVKGRGRKSVITSSAPQLPFPLPSVTPQLFHLILNNVFNPNPKRRQAPTNEQALHYVDPRFAIHFVMEKGVY